MTTIEIKPNVKVQLDELLNSLLNLATPELEKIIGEAGHILTLRKSNPPLSEADKLLSEIKNAIPFSVQKRFKQLKGKLQNGTISERERDEMRQITTFMEERSALRVTNLARLASIRNITVRQLMEELGMKRPHEQA